MEQPEPTQSGPSWEAGGANPEPAAERLATATADLPLQTVIPPPVWRQQATHTTHPPATTTIGSTTPHPQGVAFVPASHTSRAAGDINPPAAAALSRADVGGNHHHAPISTGPALKLPSPKMIFSDLYKSPKSPFNKLRGATPHALPLSPDYDPDLVSKDKTKQKEAVRRFLLQKIRNDWDFTWPPAAPVPSTSPLPVAVDEIDPAVPAQDEHGVPQENDKLEVTTAPAADDELAPKDEGDEADSESGAETDYSVVSEDRVHFRPRAEWTSDLSDDDEPAPSPSPFRFDSPDAVGSVVQATMMAKRRRRRKALRDEAQWNVGLACFEARRSAWTGAKTVRVKPKPPSPVSPASPRRLFWRSHHRADSTASNGPAPTLSAALSPTTTHASQGTASPPASDPDTRSNASSTTKPTSASTTGLAEPTPLYPVETLLPIPPPLLPPQNGMRASVTPSIYPSLYDKIVVHSLQPSCPVNLGDMVRACVVGWKRDGEWPPKPSVAVAIPPVAPTYAALAVRAHRKTNSSAAAARLEHARNASGAANGPTRRMSFGALLGRVDKEKPAEDRERERRDSQHDDEGKGIRKSLHKVFSLGHGHPATTGE